MKYTRKRLGPSLTSYRNKKHIKNTNQHTPRPRNAFIMFRQYYHRSVQGGGSHQKNNSEVSKELGLRWKSLPAQEKSYWENLARAEKELFAKKHEEYRFVDEQTQPKPDKPALSLRNELQPSPSIKEQAISIPPIINMVPSHIWQTPAPNCHSAPMGSNYGAVHPRSFLLPYPQPPPPQVPSQFLNYRFHPVQHLQFYPSQFAPQRLPPLDNYVHVANPPPVAGNYFPQEQQRPALRKAEFPTPIPYSVLNA